MPFSTRDPLNDDADGHGAMERGGHKREEQPRNIYYQFIYLSIDQMRLYGIEGEKKESPVYGPSSSSCESFPSAVDGWWR